MGGWVAIAPSPPGYATAVDSDLFIHTKFKHFTDKYKKNGRQRKEHTVISVSCHPTKG